MRRYIAIALAVAAVAIIAALLTGCSSGETANAQAQPQAQQPAPKSYVVVKHMNPEGVPFATYRVDYAQASQGCIMYRLEGTSFWAYACGNVSVTVEYEK